MVLLARNHKSWVLTFPLFDKSGASTYSTRTNNVIWKNKQKSPQWSWNHKNRWIFLFAGSAGSLCLAVLSSSGFGQQEVPHVQSWTPVSHDWLQILTDWSVEPGPDREEAEHETFSSSQRFCFMLFCTLTLYLSYLCECHCLRRSYTICFS